MTKGPRLSRLGVLAPAALSVFIDASVLAAPAAGAILSTVLKELSKAFMLKKWFHGVMTASEAEHLLMDKGKNGSYLVRESQTHHGEYVLSVRVRGHVSHVMIRREHNKYNVGSGELFDDLAGLIEHCRAYPLIETSGDVLRLMQPVNAPRASAKPLDIVHEAVGRRHAQFDDDMDDSEGQEEFTSSNSNSPIDNSIKDPNIDTWVEMEYNSLRFVDAHTSFTKIEGKRMKNTFKNRYRNVLPYDQTRVILSNHASLPESEFNDYINASYIRPSPMFGELISGRRKNASAPSLDVAGPSTAVQPEGAVCQFDDVYLGRPTTSRNIFGQVKDKYYIATQGCLWTTMHAFWQMVVDNDVRVIAMLTEMEEMGKRKCEMYWPEEGQTRQYGNVRVYSVHEYEHVFYVYRHLKVTTSDEKRRNVYQYQFKCWPDHDVPSDTEAILKYAEEVNERMYQVSQEGYAAPKENIILAHCSAGIGRTGTYIALDMIMDKIKRDGTEVNIQSTVQTCRYQRAGMVQNLKQYQFLHLAVNDYIKHSTLYKQNNACGVRRFHY